MAFIRRSGSAPFLDALRAHTSGSAPLRVLTTVYTGSTEAAALDLTRRWSCRRRSWRWLDGRTPFDRARVLLAALLAPGFLGALLTLAWYFDVAILHAERGCRAALAGAWPAALVQAGLGLASARLLALGLATGTRVLRALRLCRHLAERSRVCGATYVVAVVGAFAFAAGFLRPRVFVSEELARRLDARSLAAVLAHERAHARRRDPLRALFAELGAVAHAPWIGNWLRARLLSAHEQAADLSAAREVGDRRHVASTLVQTARLRAQLPLSLAWGGGALEERVRAFLSPERRGSGASSTVLVGLASVATLGALLTSRGIHALLLLRG